MRRALFLLPCLALAACDRHDASSTDASKGGSSKSARANGNEDPASRRRSAANQGRLLTGEMPAPHETRVDPAKIEKARTLAGTDPESGLRWLFASGYIQEDPFHGPTDYLLPFLQVLMEKNPRAGTDLSDLIESDATRRIYLRVAYQALARRDAEQAWALWRERGGKAEDSPVDALLRPDLEASGFSRAWERYQSHDPAADPAEMLDLGTGPEEKFSEADAALAITLLQRIGDPERLSGLLKHRADTLARANPSAFGAWLESLPPGPRNDEGYGAMVRASSERHDFPAAQKWLERITDAEWRDRLTAEMREAMSSVPVEASTSS